MEATYNKSTFKIHQVGKIVGDKQALTLNYDWNLCMYDSLKYSMNIRRDLEFIS